MYSSLNTSHQIKKFQFLAQYHETNGTWKIPVSYSMRLPRLVVELDALTFMHYYNEGSSSCNNTCST